MKQIKHIAFVALIGSVLSMRSQDVHFSQVNETPLLINPANTGFYNGYVRGIINYRNQWQAMGKAFETMNLSFDAGLFKSKKRKSFLGLGVLIYQDKAGAAKFRKYTALLNLSGILKVSSRSVLSAGICGGAIGNNADYSKLTFASQFDGNTIDASAPNGENVIFRQFTTTDLGAGLAYEFTKSKVDQDHDDMTSFRIGAAAYHLNRPKQEFSPGSAYRLPVRWVGSFNAIFDIEDTKLSLTPAFIYQRQAAAWQYIGGSYLKVRLRTGTKVTGEKTINSIGAGLFYRSKDALIPKVIYEMGDLAFGVSYDVNISGYKSASKYMGGFEISIRYNKLANSLFDASREFR